MTVMTLKISAIVVVIITLVILWIMLRKLERRNKVVSLDESLLSWSEVKCPNCRQLMGQGYALAGRGIIWAPKNAKKPGPFAHIGEALEIASTAEYGMALHELQIDPN
jgi:hypothetical protein